MAEGERASVLHWVRRLSAEAGGASDAQLLGRFAAGRDEAAFELLLWRHAPLVYGVCRRVLHDPHDAEDAFQATFLALARHAGRIARREAVAGWLHRVAYRTALTVQRRRARRDRRETLGGRAEHVAATPDAAASPENQELRRVLDQEIGRLPARFRAAVVLCYLEGKSVDEAARLLGCPRGTVASRLARARERLRGRLAGRGLALTAVLAILAPADAAPRPLVLIPTLVAAALRYTAGGAAAPGVASTRVIPLAEEVLRAMLLHKLQTGAAVLAAVLGTLLAVGGLAVGLHANASPGEGPEAPRAGRDDQAGGEPVARAPQPVTVSHPVRRVAAPYQDYTGRLEAHRVVEVRPAVGGFVQQVRFKAGTDVKQGEVLFELDPRTARLALDKAEAELAVAQARKRQSEADMDRVHKLKEAKAVAPEELGKAMEQAATATAAVKSAKVEVDRARLELEATQVVAPMSGRVGRPLVEPGALVFRGPDRATLLTTVTSLDPIGLTFDMDERSFLEYQRLLRAKQVKGAGGVLRMGLTGEDGYPHEGTLDGFEDRFSPQSGAVRVRGRFPNPDRLLLPGMFARVRLTFGLPRAVLEVPAEAVFAEQGTAYVLVANEHNVAERRAVTLGPADQGIRVVEKGLGADDWVVIAGLGGVRAGDPVEPRRKAPPQRPDPGRDPRR